MAVRSRSDAADEPPGDLALAPLCRRWVRPHRVAETVENLALVLRTCVADVAGSGVSPSVAALDLLGGHCVGLADADVVAERVTDPEVGAVGLLDRLLGDLDAGRARPW
jgi:hypothetical protein